MNVRGGTETNRKCFADICKSWQSRVGSQYRIYCLIDALKAINTPQRHLDNKHRQLILPICTRFIANLTLQTLADIGKALPISLCATPYSLQYYNPVKGYLKVVYSLQLMLLDTCFIYNAEKCEHSKWQTLLPKKGYIICVMQASIGILNSSCSRHHLDSLFIKNPLDQHSSISSLFFFKSTWTCWLTTSKIKFSEDLLSLSCFF